MSFLRRQGLLRGLDSHQPTTPELQPGDGIQAHMNSASLQGGGEIRLGPYEFRVFQPLSVPENVTLVGVPRMTKLIKEVPVFDTAGEYDESVDLGPVVKMQTLSSIRDIYVDLVLPTTGGVEWYFNDGVGDENDLIAGGAKTLQFTTSDINCVIRVDGAYSEVKGCIIPNGGRRGITVIPHGPGSLILGNRIGNMADPPGEESVSIYLEDAVWGCVVMNNWCVGANGVGTISVDLSVPIKNAIGVSDVSGGSGTVVLNEEFGNLADIDLRA